MLRTWLSMTLPFSASVSHLFAEVSGPLIFSQGGHSIGTVLQQFGAQVCGYLPKPLNLQGINNEAD